MEGARLSEDPLLTSIKLSEALTDTGDDEKEEGRKGKVIFRSVIRDNNQLPERLSLFGALKRGDTVYIFLPRLEVFRSAADY